MELVEKNIRARDIINEKSIINALAVDMALGCSTNTVLHLAAIASEAQTPFELSLINEISGKTPNLCKLAPAGKHHVQDLHRAGGIYAVMKELAKKNLIDTSLITATCGTVEDNLAFAKVKDYEVIRPIDKPYSQTGGLAVLFGNLAPKGSVVKRSAVAPQMLKFAEEQGFLTAKKTPLKRFMKAPYAKEMWW